MDREQLLNLIRDLAKSQGAYGRLLQQIDDLRAYDEGQYNDLMEYLESKNFKDGVEFILAYEG
jgi:hypothetical protein